jgi:hypothetical protein
VRVAEESARSFRSPYSRAYSLRPRLCIAMLASRRHLHTSPPGIEGMICPLDTAILGQLPTLAIRYVYSLFSFFPSVVSWPFVA